MEPFAKFEHEGCQRVAGKYDPVWARSTRQFIPPLLGCRRGYSKLICSRRWLWPPATSRPRWPNAAQHRAASIFLRKWSQSRKRCFRKSNSAKAMRKICRSPTSLSIASWPTSLCFMCLTRSALAPKLSVSSNPAANSASRFGPRRRKIHTQRSSTTPCRHTLISRSICQPARRTICFLVARSFDGRSNTSGSMVRQ